MVLIYLEVDFPRINIILWKKLQKKKEKNNFMET